MARQRSHTNGDSTGSKPASVRRLDEIFAEHGMAPPDEFVGPDNSKYFLDYGDPPVVLADSRRPQDRSEHENELWKQFRKLVDA